MPMMMPPGQNGNMMDMIGNMMENPMMKQMMANPDFMKQAGSMMNGGGMNMSSMQDMMKNPSLQGLVSNPDFLSNALNMMKDPNNKGMLEAMGMQHKGVNVGAFVKVLEVLVKLSQGYRKVKSILAHKLT